MNSDIGNSERYLLCRPRNGLNDTLVQIERCWRHAEKFNRILIIDPINSASVTNLSLFFSPLSPTSRVYFHVLPDQLEHLNKLPCQPNALTGRVSDYKGVSVQRGARWIVCDEKTNTPLWADLDRDYPEPMLLHESGGGGKDGIEFLKRVKLEPNLARDIHEKIRKLGSNYAAVHIRHSDLKTDWRKFLRSIRRALRGRTVLICSDSSEVIKAAPLILKDSTIRTVSELVYTDGQPQHRRLGASDESRNATMRAALVDLLAMGAASDLFITCHDQGATSGFSRLAASICRDKSFVNSLLGIDLFPQGTAGGKVHLVLSIVFRSRQFYKRWVRNIRNFVSLVVRSSNVSR